VRPTLTIASPIADQARLRLPRRSSIYREALDVHPGIERKSVDGVVKAKVLVIANAHGGLGAHTSPCADCQAWIVSTRYFDSDTLTAQIERNARSGKLVLTAQRVKDLVPFQAMGARKTKTDRPLEDLPVIVSDDARSAMMKTPSDRGIDVSARATGLVITAVFCMREPQRLHRRTPIEHTRSTKLAHEFPDGCGTLAARCSPVHAEPAAERAACLAISGTTSRIRLIRWLAIEAGDNLLNEPRHAFGNSVFLLFAQEAGASNHRAVSRAKDADIDIVDAA
jgi:hypothetical protein